MEAVERLALELSEDASQAQGLLDFRRRALERLRGLLRFDAALFHELSPRAPLERAALVGLEHDALAQSALRWDENAVLFGRLRDLALARGGLATDAEAFPRGSRARAQWIERVDRAFDVKSTLALHLQIGERVVSVVLLFRRRAQAFSAREQAALRALAPALAVGDALHQALASRSQPGFVVQLRCLDQRLTARQRDVVERVALGHTNAHIGLALGLSVNTIRNLLSDARRRVGAANRAELVRIAVLR